MYVGQGSIVTALQSRALSVAATCFQYHGYGRRTGLKIRSSQEGVGSSPTFGTFPKRTYVNAGRIAPFLSMSEQPPRWSSISVCLRPTPSLRAERCWLGRLCRRPGCHGPRSGPPPPPAAGPSPRRPFERGRPVVPSSGAIQAAKRSGLPDRLITRAERPKVMIAAADRDDRPTAGLAKTIGRVARRSRHGQRSKVGRCTSVFFSTSLPRCRTSAGESPECDLIRVGGRGRAAR